MGTNGNGMVGNRENTWCGHVQRGARVVNDLTVAKIQGVFLTPAPSGVMMRAICSVQILDSRTYPFHQTPYHSTISLAGFNTPAGQELNIEQVNIKVAVSPPSKPKNLSQFEANLRRSTIQDTEW